MTNPKQDSPSLDEVKVEELIARCKKCRDIIGQMCEQGRGPRMSVPADHERDEDLFIVDTLLELERRLSEKAVSRLSGDARPRPCFFKDDTDGAQATKCRRCTYCGSYEGAACMAQLAHPAEKQASESSPAQGDAVDAARYRWLRAGNYPIDFARSVLNDTPHGIDAAIDAARGTTKESGA